MLCLVCQFKIRMLPFLFDFFELKERAHIRRKINNQRKLFIWDALRDLLSVTIWCLYDRSNASKCMQTHVISICFYELTWRSNGSMKFQMLEFQSNGLGA